MHDAPEQSPKPTRDGTDTHAAWIKDRVRALLFHFYVPDVSAATRHQIMQDWIKVLSPYNRDEIEAACLDYIGQGTRAAPHPGAIKARIVDARQAQVRRQIEERRAQNGPEPTPDEIEARRVVTPEAANDILEQAGFRPMKFGGRND